MRWRSRSPLTPWPTIARPSPSLDYAIELAQLPSVNGVSHQADGIGERHVGGTGRWFRRLPCMVRRWPYSNINPRFDVLRTRLQSFYELLKIHFAKEPEDDLKRAEQLAAEATSSQPARELPRANDFR